MKKNLVTILVVISLAGGPEGCGLFAPATYNTIEYQTIHQAALDGNIAQLKELLKLNPEQVNVGDYDKNTPLHLAAMHGHADAVEFLLENGANVNATNSVDMTALHLAAKQGYIGVVNVLLRYEPNLDIEDSRGWTPLNWAEKTDHEEIAKLLRENGAH